MDQRYIGELLVHHGVLPQEKLDEVLNSISDKALAITDALVATRVAEEEAILQAFSKAFGFSVLTKIRPEEIPAALIEAVPINFARQHRVLPITEVHGQVQVAIADPFSTDPLDDLRVLLGRTIEPVLVPSEAIIDAINRVYERKDETALGEAREGESVEELQDLIDMTDEAPVIRWVNNLFYNAIRDRASDIHIEPAEREVVVRYRIDGTLYPVKTAHRGFLPAIVSRVKIEAGLNIAEKRLPQDGRITKKMAGKLVDVRVSTIPTSRGERVVMRLLDKQQVLLSLTDLGFDPDQYRIMDSMISKPNGIILVTGPTGAGKTTTLYACLNKINNPDLNILTVEDPVEYELPGVGQMQIQPKIGLTFASGLRSFLRQDPDVIMVGEIRDHETAEIAIHASLTGHLVLSTLHTNDAASAVTRLVEMGVQPFLISSSLLCVVAQRLVRRLCPMCREPYTPSEQDLRELGLNPQAVEGRERRLRSRAIAQGAQTSSTTEATLMDASDTNSPTDESHTARASVPPPPVTAADHVFYRPTGCEACAGTGYRGRVGIYEILTIDEPIRREVLNNSDSNTIQRVASQRGMLTLREDGARQVLAGMTSIDEVLAATQSGELE
jgi:general secretion pathway protein E